MDDPTLTSYEIDKIYAVEASNGRCPDRTVWVYDGYDLWQCICCSERLAWDKLVDPAPVTS